MQFFGAGRTFVAALDRAGTHLWMVLTDPDDKGHVIVVMAVSAKAYTDRTVVLAAGDHPWIKHETHVDFGTARSMPAGKLIEAMKGRGLSLATDLSDTLLQRVRDGLLASSRTIHVVKDECRARLGLPIPDPARTPRGELPER